MQLFLPMGEVDGFPPVNHTFPLFISEILLNSPYDIFKALAVLLYKCEVGNNI